MNTKLSNKQVSIIGFMLFGIFFGAGNFIFPPLLGYQAGTNIVPALFGFLLGAVGLPLLGVIASALFGGNALKLMNRVHPLFGGIFTAALFLVLGPLFAVPRTATVAFSMAVEPFLSSSSTSIWYIMPIFMLLYFLITYYFASSPGRLVDAVGKYMTPILIASVLFIIVKALINPVGTATAPEAAFEFNALSEGLVSGFQTMDAIGALITAGIVIGAVKQFGVEDNKDITKYTIKAGIMAAVGLSVIYGGLAFVGASSGTYVEASEGATILTAVVQEIFGPFGLIFLGINIALACVSTAIALTGACASYFHQLTPSISYKKWLMIFCGFGFGISNLGLATLLAVAAPVLQILYPLVIVLIIYVFMDKLIYDKPMVYIGGVGITLVISILVELHLLGLTGKMLSFVEYLPMYSIGFAWLIPWSLTALLMYFIPAKPSGMLKVKKAA